MGVVYKARHLRLNRVVAIKMISVRSFPTEHSVRRFLAEAELEPPSTTRASCRSTRSASTRVGLSSR